MSGSGPFSTGDIRDLLSKIAKLEENYRTKQMECTTELEKHKKTQLELDSLKKEVSLLVEEKMRLCEKIGSLTENCSLKDRANENMKKDIEKRMTEMRVLERRLDEESEAYKSKREQFKQQMDDVNAQLRHMLASYSPSVLQAEADNLRKENEVLREKMNGAKEVSSASRLPIPSFLSRRNLETVTAGAQTAEVDTSVAAVETANATISDEDVIKHALFIKLQGEKDEQDVVLTKLQGEFSELTEYLNKLETNYNQSLEYINHLEEIVSKCESCSRSRDEMLQQLLYVC